MLSMPLHLVFSEVVRVEALKPLVEPIGVGLFGGKVDRLRIVDDGVFDKDGGTGAEGERNRVTGPGVNRHRVATKRQVDERVERVLLKVADHNLLYRALE